MATFELTAPDGGTYHVDALREATNPATHPTGGDHIDIGAPDGSIVRFPAGTSDDTIKSVMAKNYPAPGRAASPVTDPALLAQLNAPDPKQRVTDPALLAALESNSPTARENPFEGFRPKAANLFEQWRPKQDYRNMSDAELLAIVKPQGAAPDYSKMSDADLMKVVQPAARAASPVTDPALLAQLNAPEPPPARITDAVTDIPTEIGRTARANLDAVKAGITDRGSKGPIEGLLDTGRAMLAVPGLLASPVTGALHSLIGHPMAQAEHYVGTKIAPEIAAKDDPQKMYETAAGDVESALSAARPAGMTPLGATAVTPSKIPAPTVDQLKAAARAGYNSPEVAAVEIHPRSVANLAAKIEDDLIDKGFRPRNTPGTFDEVRNLTPPPGVNSVKVADLDSARKALKVMASEVDAVGKPTAEAAAASTAIDHINDYLPNIRPLDVIAGDAPAAAAILRDAAENWGAAKRAENVDVRLTRAERQAAKSGSGSNIENSVRQKIAGMLDVPSRSVGYSPGEITKMEEIVRGTPTRNTLRKVGKLGVDGGLSLLLHAGAVYPTHGLNLPVAAGGTIARKMGEALTARAGRDLSEMVRNRSPLVRGSHGVNAVTRALLSASPPTTAAIPYAGIAAGSPSELKRAAVVQALLAQPQQN